MTEERRRHPRVHVDVPVRLESQAAILDGRLRDICRDAVLVESPETWPVGTEARLHFVLPGADGPVAVRGKVVRVASEADGIEGMAFLFTELAPAAATQIDFFFAQLES